MTFQKGHKINLDRKWSKERNKKISLSLVNRKLSFEHIENLRKSHLGNPGYWLGKKRIGQGIGLWMRGKKFSEERKEKMRETSIKYQSYKYLPHINAQWKGERKDYLSLHAWVRKQLGNSDTCEGCGSSKLKKNQIHWANKSGNYLRDLSDWIRLCAKCHWKYDYEKVN